MLIAPLQCELSDEKRMSHRFTARLLIMSPSSFKPTDYLLAIASKRGAKHASRLCHCVLFRRTMSDIYVHRTRKQQQQHANSTTARGEHESNKNSSTLLGRMEQQLSADCANNNNKRLGGSNCAVILMRRNKTNHSNSAITHIVPSARCGRSAYHSRPVN